MLLSKELDISPLRALHLFYSTETCKQLNDDRVQLYLMSDKYIVENIINETRGWLKADVVKPKSAVIIITLITDLGLIQEEGVGRIKRYGLLVYNHLVKTIGCRISRRLLLFRGRFRE